MRAWWAWVDPGLPAAQRAALQASADAVVFDPDAEWGLSWTGRSPGFSYVVNGGTVGDGHLLAPATSTYTWDFGDGGTANGPTATHTYSGTGTCHGLAGWSRPAGAWTR